MPEALPFIGPAIAVGGALLGGSDAPSAPNGGVYQPGGTGTMDANLQKLLQNNTDFLSGDNNPYNVYSPQILQAFQQLFNTPGQAGYQSGANNAGNAYTGVGNSSLNISQLLAGTAPTSIGAGNTALSLGLDPQKALYDRTLQRVNDSANVANAQYGLTGQQAAQNVQQADSNFNIDWQQNELDRALAGLTGYNQTMATTGTTGTASQNIGSAGAGSILTGSAAPYTAGQSIGANQETALAQLIAQLMGPVTASQSTIGDLAGYMGQGINASASGASANLANYYGQLNGAAGGAVGGAALGNSLGSLFNTQASPASLLPWQQPGYTNPGNIDTSFFDQMSWGM